MKIPGIRAEAILQAALLLALLNITPLVQAEEWTSGPLSAIDQHHMEKQHEAIDALARRHFGRQLNGNKDNDFAVLQRLLDEQIVKPEQTQELQAMGVVLGQLLKKYKGLNWVIYNDRYGRSRSLQVPGFDKDFIFPVTQISRKVEVGISVDVREVYEEMEQAVTVIRNKPPF